MPKRLIVSKRGVPGPKGDQGNPGDAIAPVSTFAGLGTPTAGKIQRVSDLTKGVYWADGSRWLRFSGPVVDAAEFGVVFSTAAAPVDIKAALQSAIDSLATLPGVILLPSPPPINSSGSGVGVFLHSTGPVIVRESQAIIGPTPISLNTPFSGVGTGFRAMAGWSGEAFIKDRGWDNDPVNDYAHGFQVANIGFDGAELAPAAIAVNQMGEESWIRGCNARNMTEAGYKLVGSHASALIEWSSAWDCPYVLKLTAHPTQAPTLSGGNVRLNGLSGDNSSSAHIFLDGAHHIAAEGTKSERTVVGIEIGSVTGVGTGGSAAIIALLGGTFNAPGGETIYKVIGAVARPVIIAKGVHHSSAFTNIIEDAVRGVTIARSDYAFVLADWTYGGSSEFAGGGELILRHGFKTRRPDTGEITQAIEYTSDLLMTVRGGALGSALQDNTGTRKAKFQNAKLIFNDGATNDTNIYRVAADILGTDDDFALAVAGKTIKIKEGSNAKMGVATLSAGSVVVSTTAVTANSRILLTSQADGGTPGWLRVSARTAGTSFTITSSSGSDTSLVAWLIVEPA